MEGSSGGRQKDEWLRVRLLIYFSCAALSWTVSLRWQDEAPPPQGGSQPTWVAECLSSSPDWHIRDCYRYRKQLNACGTYQENSPIYGWWLTRGCVLCVSICSLCKEPSLISQKPFLSYYLWHQSVPFLSPTASCCSSCLRCAGISFLQGELKFFWSQFYRSLVIQMITVQYRNMQQRPNILNPSICSKMSPRIKNVDVDYYLNFYCFLFVMQLYVKASNVTVIMCIMQDNVLT